MLDSISSKIQSRCDHRVSYDHSSYLLSPVMHAIQMRASGSGMKPASADIQQQSNLKNLSFRNGLYEDP